jgi:hypothetical protein
MSKIALGAAGLGCAALAFAQPAGADPSSSQDVRITVDANPSPQGGYPQADVKAF